jgi:hypothetical protein
MASAASSRLSLQVYRAFSIDAQRAGNPQRNQQRQALNSPTVRRGIKDILLSHSKLWELLRSQPAA